MANDADADRRNLQAHIRAVAGRTPAQDVLVRDLLQRTCWPGGHGDHTEPGALQWLKRWRASQGTPIAHACTCAVGRCASCN